MHSQQPPPEPHSPYSGSVPSTEPPPDPYAAGQGAYLRDPKTKEINSLLEDARVVANAAGCGVVYYSSADTALHQRLMDEFVHWPKIGVTGPSDYDFGDLTRRLNSAIHTGLVEAGVSEEVAAELGSQRPPVMVGTNCAYWRDHPEAVYRVRQFVPGPAP
jgi:hypothetical protein